MAYKFIGLINPPKNDFGHKDYKHWMIIWSTKSDRYLCGPFLAQSPRTVLEFYTSEKGESLASFMYMLHSKGEIVPTPEDELIIAISWSQALRRLHNRSPNFDYQKIAAIWKVFFLDEQESVFVTQPES